MASKVIELEKHKPTKFAKFRLRTNQSRPETKPRIKALHEARNAFIRHVNGLTPEDMIPVAIEKITAEVISDGKEATKGNVYRATNRQTKHLLCRVS